MLETALNAHIPIIGVETNDLPNFEAILQSIAKLKVVELPKTVPGNMPACIYWTDDLYRVTVDLYNKLMAAEHQLIVLNPDKKSSLIFDAGVLPTPPEMVRAYLAHVIDPSQIESTMQVLKGLSLKSIGEIVMFTQAKCGSATIHELRRTRAMLGGSVQGLYPLDTDYDFYQMPSQLADWLSLNETYFMQENIPAKLRPRGVMLDGTPGVGKSMAAKAIAKFFDIPLYRLDIATSMNRYIGESEARIARSLALIEKESPCILLIDEVEKNLSDKDDGGVTSRILGQLLWWLSDHQSRIITVMTTNNIKNIPPELYRSGRIDFVMTIPRLNHEEAKFFAAKVLVSILGPIKTMHTNEINKRLQGSTSLSHAEVAEMMYICIKQNDWYKID